MKMICGEGRHRSRLPVEEHLYWGQCLVDVGGCISLFWGRCSFQGFVDFTVFRGLVTLVWFMMDGHVEVCVSDEIRSPTSGDGDAPPRKTAW